MPSGPCAAPVSSASLPHNMLMRKCDTPGCSCHVAYYASVTVIVDACTSERHGDIRHMVSRYAGVVGRSPVVVQRVCVGKTQTPTTLLVALSRPTDQPTDRPTDRTTDRPTDRPTATQVNKRASERVSKRTHTNKQTHTHTCKRTNGQTVASERASTRGIRPSRHCY